MLRIVLRAFIVCTAAQAMAQAVPGRDLLTYPLGLSAEPPALGEGAASGLWNPATALLRPGERGRVAASAFSAPIDLSLKGQVFHGALLRSFGTVALTIERAGISDLAHTETDPQSVGNDIPYTTTVVSAGVARRVSTHLVAGVAGRWHSGHVYQRTRNAAVADAGVVVDGISSHDLRFAASTFLLQLGPNGTPTYSFAADARITGTDSLRTIRAGASFSGTRYSIRERYGFIEARFGKLGVRGGPVSFSAYGATAVRLRMGVLLKHATYTIALAREENGNGLAPAYQLGVSNIFR